MNGHQRAGVISEDFLCNALKCYIRLSIDSVLGDLECPRIFFFVHFILENPRSSCLSQSYRWPFFGNQNNISINPKATVITYLQLSYHESSRWQLSKSEGRKRPSEKTQFTAKRSLRCY